MNILNAADKLKKARAGLILDHPFFGALSMRLVLREDGRLATGAVDGKSIRYNPNWVDGLTLAKAKGFLAHEVLHVAAGHCWRRGGREMGRWNIAADYAINSIVADAGMELPDGGLLDPTLAQHAAEDIYHTLPDRGDDGNEHRPGNGGAGADGEAGPSGPSSADADQDADPTPENGASQESGDGEPDQGGQDGQSGADADDSDADSANGGGESDESDQDDGNVPDPGGCGAVEDAPADAPSDLEDLQKEWKIATQQAAQAAKSMGHMPGNLERLVETAVESRVSWPDLLRDFIVYAARNDYDWSLPNRRHIGRGIILPGIRSKELPPIVVAVDTSGSIGPAELAAFEAEVGAILEDFETTLHVVYCDTEVTYTEDFSRADLPVKLTPRGGGGTAFGPVFEHVEAEDLQPAALIYLTDLYGRFPEREPDYPVLWVCTSEQVAPWGQTAKLMVEP